MQTRGKYEKIMVFGLVQRLYLRLRDK